MATKRLMFVMAALALLGLARPALAQDKAERPWAKGVSPQEQRAAVELFLAGNALLKEALFQRAVEKYREALKHWDHPAVHYNLALALLNFDNPVEVHQHLEKAMAYGEAPLDTEKYQHAKSYRALIEKELAHVVINCDATGAVVTMDGNQIFVAPGKYDALVKSGQHTIIATKVGFVPTERTKKLPPGELTAMSLKLYTADDSISHTRKWDVWKPWVVVGGGALFVAAGVLFQVQSSSAYSDYDSGVVACGGCFPQGDLADKKSSGDLFKTMSIVSYGIGGAALVTGAVLVYMNRTRDVKINPGEQDGPAPGSSVSFAPLIGPGVSGAVVSGRF